MFFVRPQRRKLEMLYIEFCLFKCFVLYFFSRLFQMAKLYLFGPSSGLYSCPLAMVDGAAKVLETVMKDPECDSKFLQEPFQ